MKSPCSFLNTPDEWHAAVMGFSDGYYPLRRNCLPDWMGPDDNTRREAWYYGFGRCLGFASLIATGYGLYALIT